MEWMTKIRCDPAEEHVVSCITYSAQCWRVVFVETDFDSPPNFRRKDSNWLCWAAFVYPHHAEEAYWSFEMTIAWNSDWSSNPCDLRTIMSGQMK